MNPYEPPQSSTPVAIQTSPSSADASAWWFFFGVVATRVLFHFGLNLLGADSIKETSFLVFESIGIGIFLTFFYLIASSLITIGIFRLRRPWWLQLSSAFVFTLGTSWIALGMNLGLPRQPVVTTLFSLAVSLAICIAVEVVVGLRAALKDI